MSLTIGSLFSGYGGLDMAVAEVFGAETVWHVEYDAAPSKILAHHYPHVPNYGDVTTVDWATVEPIDILTGGFPCQDVSAAGKGAGLQAGTRTGLFHEVIKAIGALRPQFVVLENVLGLLTADGDEWPDSVRALDEAAGKWRRVEQLIDHKIAKARRTGRLTSGWEHRKEAERVRASRQRKRAVAEFSRERARLVPRAIATVLRCLAEVGYDARWTCIRASDIGAPHHRERVFILATPTDADGERSERGIAARPFSAGQRRTPGGGGREVSPDPDGVGRGQGARQSGTGAPQEPAPVGGVGALPTDRRTDDLLTRDEIRGTDSGLYRDELHFTDIAHAYGDRTVLVVLPTPTVGNAAGTNERRGGARGDELLLPGVAVAAATGALLPTPAACNPNDGEGTETWMARRERVKERVKNGNGMGMPLTIAVQTLPTPSAADGERGPDYARADREGSGGDDLVTIAARASNGRGIAWGRYEAVIRRWETILGHPAPAPVELNSNNRPRLAAEFAEWMMGLPAGWVTDPAIGISRADHLKAIGNGVCPQQAIAALCRLIDMPARESVVA